jgi:putative phosphoribosyl transferase
VGFLDQQTVEALGISESEIERVTAQEKQELERRENVYRVGRSSLKMEGLTAILVDDGIATGASMHAAIAALRQMKPARIVVAVPVAPPSTCERLRSEVDDLVCVYAPELFYAIGQFYDDFSQVTDEQVIDLIQRASQTTAGKVA